MAGLLVPQVLILRLGNDKGLFEGRFGAQVRLIEQTYRTREIVDAQSLNLFTWSRPKAVIVVDNEIGKAVHASLLAQLGRFTKAGGTVILAFLFPTTCNDWEFGSVFWEFQRPSWKPASSALNDFVRTNLRLNEAVKSSMGEAYEALETTYEIQAIHLMGVAPHERVYVEESKKPSSTDYAEDHLDGCSAAFAQVGAGYLGYVGDYCMESGTIALLMAMLARAMDPRPSTRVGSNSTSSHLNVNGNAVHNTVIRPLAPVKQPTTIEPPPRGTVNLRLRTPEHTLLAGSSYDPSPSRVPAITSKDSATSVTTVPKAAIQASATFNHAAKKADTLATPHILPSGPPGALTNASHPSDSIATPKDEARPSHAPAVTAASFKMKSAETVEEPASATVPTLPSPGDLYDGDLLYDAEYACEISDLSNPDFTSLGYNVSSLSGRSNLGSEHRSWADPSDEDRVMPLLADCNPGCSVCGILQPAKKCTACRKIQYCSIACQKEDWPSHKNNCARTQVTAPPVKPQVVMKPASEMSSILRTSRSFVTISDFTWDSESEEETDSGSWSEGERERRKEAKEAFKARQIESGPKIRKPFRCSASSPLGQHYLKSKCAEKERADRQKNGAQWN